jgi:hypothetical protein
VKHPSHSQQNWRGKTLFLNSIWQTFLTKRHWKSMEQKLTPGQRCKGCSRIASSCYKISSSYKLDAFPLLRDGEETVKCSLYLTSGRPWWLRPIHLDRASTLVPREVRHWNLAGSVIWMGCALITDCACTKRGDKCWPFRLVGSAGDTYEVMWRTSRRLGITPYKRLKQGWLWIYFTTLANLASSSEFSLAKPKNNWPKI